MKKLTSLILIICGFSFNLFAQETGTFIDDRDGHKYKWVKIGEQVWMAENLAFAPVLNERNDKSKKEQKIYSVEYVDLLDSTNTFIKGFAYNWTAAINLCPDGWKLPDKNDWNQLGEFISSEHDDCKKVLYEWRGVGNYLKVGYPDNYGFNALPVKNLDKKGKLISLNMCYFWSAWKEPIGSRVNAFNIDYPSMYNDNSGLFWGLQNSSVGLAVRCIKK